MFKGIKMKFKIFFILLFSFSLVSAQEVKLFPLKKYRVSVLQDSLKESSGLNFFGNRLFTFNDSGNTSEIFEMNFQTGKIVKKYPTQLQNTDWEALTNDGKAFYIGDFGNNTGNRKDLKIFKIPFDNDSLQMRNLYEISFFYPEQNNFSPKNLNTNFDAEGMIFYSDKINIFTKEWVSKSVSRYEIDPNLKGNQAARKLESYPTNFVVTDAAYYNKQLFLLGYTKKTEVFLNIFNEDENRMFFNQKPQSFYLGTVLAIGQVEGIAVNEEGVYISSEKFVFPFGSTKPSFYFIPKIQLP